MFLDECGVNIAMTRRYARSKRGTRALGHTPKNYGANVSVLGAIRLSGVVSALSLDGSVDGESFKAWTREGLAKELRPGDVVVMDNLSVHKVKGVRESIEAVGASLLYLPSYSPDLNPIEPCWSKLKTFLRAWGARTREALYQGLVQGFDRIQPSDLIGWFKHCGYRQSN